MLVGVIFGEHNRAVFSLEGSKSFVLVVSRVVFLFGLDLPLLLLLAFFFDLVLAVLLDLLFDLGSNKFSLLQLLGVAAYIVQRDDVVFVWLCVAVRLGFFTELRSLLEQFFSFFDLHRCQGQRLEGIVLQSYLGVHYVFLDLLLLRSLL